MSVPTASYPACGGTVRQRYPSRLGGRIALQSKAKKNLQSKLEANFKAASGIIPEISGH
jgi:hypothetical protein